MRYKEPLRAWAVLDDSGLILGGDYRCAIFWTRKGALEYLRDYNSHGKIVPVIVARERGSDARGSAHGNSAQAQSDSTQREKGTTSRR